MYFKLVTKTNDRNKLFNNRSLKELIFISDHLVPLAYGTFGCIKVSIF